MKLRRYVPLRAVDQNGKSLLDCFDRLSDFVTLFTTEQYLEVADQMVSVKEDADIKEEYREYLERQEAK